MSSDGEQKFIGFAPERNPAGVAVSFSHQKATQTREVTIKIANGLDRFFAECTQPPQPDEGNHLSRWHVRMRASHGLQLHQSHRQNAAQCGSRLQTVCRHVLSRLQTTARLDALMKFLDQPATFIITNHFPRILECGDRKTGPQHPMYCRHIVGGVHSNHFSAGSNDRRLLDFGTTIKHMHILHVGSRRPDQINDSPPRLGFARTLRRLI
jgi:hypothetical protein